MILKIDGRGEWASRTFSKRSIPEAEDVRAYIAAEIRKLLAIREFLDALPGYLLPDQANQPHVSILLERLKKIATL